MSSLVLPPKRNNFLQNEESIIQNIKYLLILEALFGVNRLHLCGYRRCVLWSSYIYSTTFLLCIVFYIQTGELLTVSQHFYKYTACIEYLLLGVYALLMQRCNFVELFSIFETFDKNLGIQSEVSLMCPKRWYLYRAGFFLLYSICEIVFCVFFVYYDYEVTYSLYVATIPVVILDFEMIFFGFLLVLILRRLCLIQIHVAKVFNKHFVESKEHNKHSNQVKELVKRADLDVTSLHNAYDLLHKSSELLNSIMSFSVIVMLITIGLSTIMILKNALSVMHTNQFLLEPDVTRSIVIFASARCLKYILLLILPCYISNKTKSQVALIRSIIYNNLTSNELDKKERRKLKAFLQLTGENDFSYSVWGVLKLDMSFPLTFSSLCITYLIIVVQFSKFFD